MSADLLQSQGEKSEKKVEKIVGKKVEKKVEKEKTERKIWMALTGLRKNGLLKYQETSFSPKYWYVVLLKSCHSNYGTINGIFLADNTRMQMYVGL